MNQLLGRTVTWNVKHYSLLKLRKKKTKKKNKKKTTKKQKQKKNISNIVCYSCDQHFNLYHSQG